MLGFLTLAVTAVVARQAPPQDQARLERDAGLLASMVKQRFDSHRDGLVALRVALERGGAHDWLTFSNQVETLYPWLNYPAFTEFAFLHRFLGEHRTNFPKVVRERAHAPFELRFPTGRPEFWISFPVLFHHYVRQHDQPPPGVFTNWGLDLNQDAAERDRMTWSWGADRPATTRGGNSVWGPAPPSKIRIYVPVLSPAPTGEELSEQWQGVVETTRKQYAAELRSGELTPEDLVRGARGRGKMQQLHGLLVGHLDVAKLLAVAFPSNAPALAVLIRDESGDVLAGQLPVTAYLRTSRKERYNGRDWHFDFATTPAWEVTALRWWAWVVLALGGTLTVGAGLTTGFWSLARQQDQEARRLAELYSNELARARDDLRAVQAARDQLQRNLHDAVLQRLYAAALHARQTWQAAVRGEPVATEEMATQVSELDAAMAELRTFLGGPAQRELSEAELASALRGLAQAFSRQTGVAVQMDAASATLAELSLEARAQLLPMVREGLSNAWRHGHASEITLTVSSAAGDVTVTVTDDGGGFDPTSNTPGGRGLKNLAERSAQSGGTFRVKSQTGGPTTLCFEWKGGGDDATA